jgi:hypothetical protein
MFAAPATNRSAAVRKLLVFIAIKVMKKQCISKISLARELQKRRKKGKFGV